MHRMELATLVEDVNEVLQHEHFEYLRLVDGDYRDVECRRVHVLEARYISVERLRFTQKDKTNTVST